MSATHSCTYCGCRASATGTLRSAEDVTTIELLTREVHELQRTVALLRGSLGHPHGAEHPAPGRGSASP